MSDIPVAPLDETDPAVEVEEFNDEDIAEPELDSLEETESVELEASEDDGDWPSPLSTWGVDPEAGADEPGREMTEMSDEEAFVTVDGEEEIA